MENRARQAGNRGGLSRAFAWEVEPGWLGWLPLPLFLVLIVGLWASQLPQTYELPWLSLLVNFLFRLVTAGAVAFLLSRCFLERRSLGLLFMGCGVLVWGVAGVMGASVGRSDANVRITIHNLGFACSGLLYLVGAIHEMRPGKTVANPRVWLVLGYGLALVAVAGFALFARQGWTAPFFVSGQGGTWVRSATLGLSLAAFALTAALVFGNGSRPRSSFASWYGLYLGLNAVGLIALLAHSASGSLLEWASRAVFSLGGCYLLLAAWVSVRELGVDGLTLTTMTSEGWPGYAFAACIITAAMILRLSFDGVLGSGYPFVTFFPGVMLAALFGGWGPGLLATFLSLLLVEAFLVSRVGLAGLVPADYLSAVFFLVSGWMISSLVERMHRAQAQVSVAEAKAKAAMAREQVDRVLRRTVEELTRSNEELERFAYVASHDLQEPLRMVRAYVGLLRDRYRGQLDAKADQYIAFAEEGAERMHGLIHDLLAYARLDSRGKGFAIANAEDALNQALAGLRGAIEASGAKVTRDPLPLLLVDPTQLAQVFQNLLSNAIKFRSGAGPELHIGCQRRGADCVLFIRDDGIGIDGQQIHRIFDLFQQGNARNQYDGTGIGLAICKKIVERHGGRIWVESIPGQGSTFLFSLPESAGGEDEAR